jgi:hypothetical protein
MTTQKKWMENWTHAILTKKKFCEHLGLTFILFATSHTGNEKCRHNPVNSFTRLKMDQCQLICLPTKIDRWHVVAKICPNQCPALYLLQQPTTTIPCCILFVTIIGLLFWQFWGSDMMIFSTCINCEAFTVVSSSGKNNRDNNRTCTTTCQTWNIKFRNGTWL